MYHVLKGCPHRMKLQRRLYGMYTVCFLTFMIPCNYKFQSKIIQVVFTVPFFVWNPVYTWTKFFLAKLINLNCCLRKLNIWTFMPEIQYNYTPFPHFYFSSKHWKNKKNICFWYILTQYNFRQTIYEPVCKLKCKFDKKIILGLSCLHPSCYLIYY